MPVFAALSAVLLLSCVPRGFDHAASHLDGQRRFYEGWYLRLTDADQGESFGLIYGIAHDRGAPDGGAGYLIALSAADGERAWTRVPVARTSAPHGVYDISIGEADGPLYGHIDADGGRGWFQAGPDDGDRPVAWDLALTPTRTWTARHDSPMGWVQRWKGFQTYWHVVALQARVSGTVRFGDRSVHFDDALGYVERNWGRVFPRDWMWLQAGSFVDPATGAPRDGALSASGGHVPLAGPIGTKAGIVGYWDGDAMHHFATHTGQKVRLRYAPGDWEVVARGGGEKLVVRAGIDPDALVPIAGPTRDGVQDVAIESLDGRLVVELFRRARPFGRWRLQHRAESGLAGVEVGGLAAVEAAAARSGATESEGGGGAPHPVVE
ncbi:MAG: hypothetical protein H6742_08580 [Alphaproteobacteria bacterium]|nr:hypothetical protein [Alphaproteobacteria bacterium]